MKGVVMLLAMMLAVALSVVEGTQDDTATIEDGTPLLLAAPMMFTVSGDKRTGIKEACKILREIMSPLEKERRVDILRCLPPGEKKSFGQLQQECSISAGSLHDHLKVLLELGYIHRTDERPVRYFSNEYVEKLCELATYWKSRKIVELTKELYEYQQENPPCADVC